MATEEAYGAIVLGVTVAVIESDDRERYYLDEDEGGLIDDASKEITLESALSAVAGEAVDLRYPIKRKDIKLYVPDVHLVEQGTLGVALANSYKEDIFDITDLLQLVSPGNVERRSREISKYLRRLGLPCEPVRVYLVGNVDI